MIATNTPNGSTPVHQREPQPASDFAPRRRPPLEILPDGYLSPRSRRRRARLAAVGGILLACGMLFGLAGVHVLLTQGEFRLAHYQTKADAEQARYLRLRQAVAELESPGRIVATAQQQLGMVSSASPTYFSAVGPFTEPSTLPEPGAAAASSPGKAPLRESPPSLKGWAAAKSALPTRP